MFSAAVVSDSLEGGSGLARVSQSIIGTGKGIAAKSAPKHRRKIADETAWKINITKMLRNSGQEYSRGNKSREARKMKEPCGTKCKFNCTTRVTEEQRKDVFGKFWGLGSINLQRQFIANSMKEVVPKVRLQRLGPVNGPRQPNNSFHFRIGGSDVRVCKTMFKNTLDISDRMFRTVLEKRNKIADILLEPDKRGTHNNHKKLDPKLKEAIIEHINSIPRIKRRSRAKGKTTRELIDGGNTIMSMYRDYVKSCSGKGCQFGKYSTYYRIFKDEFNIVFYNNQKKID